MGPTRILHVAETIRGGPATVLTQHLLAQQARFGQDNVRALVPDQHVQDLEEIDASVLRTFRRTGRNAGSLLRLAAAFHEAMRTFRPTVVHLHSTFAGAIARPMLAGMSRASRPRVVYSPHAWAFMMDRSELQRKLAARIERMLLPLTDVVICVSEYERQSALAFGLPSSKLAVVCNGVAAPRTGAPRLRHTEGMLRALFVGRLDRQKGFDILDDAMSLLTPEAVHLEVIGDPVSGGTKPAPRPNITYRGWQSPLQVEAAMRNADVLVMPSRWESFGLVAVEAQKNGCAVLATNVGSLPEVVEDGVTGKLVPAGDAVALAVALMQTSQRDWQAIGDTAAAIAGSRFTVDAMVSKTLALYRPT